MKIWLLSELFYPVETSTGYFMTKIAEQLSERNLDGIHVICGPEKYDSDKLVSNEKLDFNITIHRANIYKLNKNSLLQRSFRMGLLAAKMTFKLWKMCSKEDKVFLVTNPAFLLVMASLIKKIKGFQLIIIVHDVFPENMLAGGMIKSTSLVFKILRKIFNISYQQADKIVCVGEDMNELILEKTKFKNDQTSVIRNWADCDQIYPLNFNQESICNYYGLPELKDKIIIQFAGNIGRVQGLIEFIRIFGNANNEHLAFLLIGEGAIKKSLESIIVNEKIRNVYFILAKTRHEQNYFLSASHIGLVSLNAGMYGLGVPSKTYNIWAAGKPVLFIGDEDSEIARNIVDHNIGWAFNWNMKNELMKFLQSLTFDSFNEIISKGVKSRETALEYYDRAVILKQYDKI